MLLSERCYLSMATRSARGGISAEITDGQLIDQELESSSLHECIWRKICRRWQGLDEVQRRSLHPSKAGNEKTTERRRVEADKLRLLLSTARKLVVVPLFRESQAAAPPVDEYTGMAVGGAPNAVTKPRDRD